MAIKKTTDQILSEFRATHGDTYDYSNVVYENINTPVEIICEKHGVFKQQPRAHKSGQGCPKCTQKPNWKPKLTSDEYYDKVKEIHNGIYSYKSDYTSTLKPISIFCEVHGWFMQKASSHLNGKGCQKCARNQKKSTTEFIEQANKTHNDKYDYSKTIYKSSADKVIIICKKHGEFKQKPPQHISGQGCPDCGIESMRNKLSNDQSEFISKLCVVHNNKYEYSEVVYNSRSSFITITCPQHGNFQQRASEHLRGYGCPKCAGNKL